MTTARGAAADELQKKVGDGDRRRRHAASPVRARSIGLGADMTDRAAIRAR